MNAHWKRYHSLYIGTGCLLLAVFVIALQCGCNSNEPKTEIDVPPVEAPIEGDGNTVKTKIKNEVVNESVQVSNSVWPWMIVVIAQPLLFLAFLYFSNSWKGKRGL